MITNFYTLKHLASELNQLFAGKTIHQIFTQNKGELVINFIETQKAIIIGCEPNDNYIFAKKSFSQAHKNFTNFFESAINTKIKNITIHPFDRQINILLSNNNIIASQMFASTANVFLLNKNNNPLEAFLKKDFNNLREKTLFDIKNFQNEPIKQAIKKTHPTFNSLIITEILYNANIDGSLICKNIDDEKFNLLNSIIKEMKNRLLNELSPCIYLYNNEPICFSIIKLNSLNQYDVKKFDSISEAINEYRFLSKRSNAFTKDKNNIFSLIKKEIEHHQNILTNLSKNINHNEWQLYEKYGKLLIANLHNLKKGDSVAVVEDLQTSELVEIPLDKFLSPSKNATRYFEKSDKSKKSAEEATKRIQEANNSIQILTLLNNQLEDVALPEQLKTFINNNLTYLKKIGFAPNNKSEKPKEVCPFRVFTVTGGFEVWAGKNGENNDMLSTRYTSKNDLWFHARGVGGSHVVLKINTGKGDVSKQAIEQTASIAAYYSKMKTSKIVPVSMCLGKYVRKPKGAPAGTVCIEREETVFAEPKLPNP